MTKKIGSRGGREEGGDVASPAEIAADYPYLSEDDVRVMLACAAAQADHPVVLAAE